MIFNNNKNNPNIVQNSFLGGQTQLAEHGFGKRCATGPQRKIVFVPRRRPEAHNRSVSGEREREANRLGNQFGPAIGAAY